MFARLRRFALPLLASVLLAGCSPGVREDRTITFDQGGKNVGFQHGREGIFIAETEGAAPTKIFQPDDDVLAVSAPLWSPTDKRLIFTTARRAGKKTGRDGSLPAEQDPAGDVHGQQPTEYTCWLREEPKAGQPLNVPIFTARCGHPGYVAANLAVRWRPDGRGLLFIEEDAQGQHGLFEYDLQAKSRRQVFPHTGTNLLFDIAPDGRQLVCVVGDKSEASKTAGIWVGTLDADAWWRVPNSTDLGSHEIEDLRAARPVWTRDAQRFAFVTATQKKDEKPSVRTLHLATPAPRTVAELTRADKPIRDLHWRPDGARLGYLCGEDTGVFHLAEPAANREKTIGEDLYCSFLGWDAGGERLAFVARQPLPRDPAQSWAFLLLPDVRARNRLLIAPDADPAQTKNIFSGMQLTFPQWSPKEAKLSLWATYRPPYRSWLSYFLALGSNANDPLRGLTLRPGDPALVFDAVTGERQWKAIDGREKTQIGHYHLMRREYAEAWSWYEQAEAADADDRSPAQFVNRFVRGRDALFFQALCLDKLGRADEASAKRRQFEETFLPDIPAAPKAPAPNQPAPFGAANLQPTKEQLLHWRDLYVAEVFLSLDAIEDGERYFRDGLKNAATDADRLSKALVLTQFLLLRDRREEYAELATDTVLPLLLRAWKPRTQGGGHNQEANLILAYSDGLSLLPLFAPNFLARLPEAQVRALVPRWRKQQASADDDVKRLGIDLFLRAAAERLGQKDEQQAAARRIAANPARTDILGDKGLPGLIEGVRLAPEMFESVRLMFR